MKKRFLLTVTLLLLLVGSFTVGCTQPTQTPSQTQTISNTGSDNEALNGSCGRERWSVKTGTDADVGLVNLQSKTPTTVASLVSLSAPSNLPPDNRIQPTETTVFQLQATLTKYKLESDSDYHLVLKDGSGHTMIVEIPSPNCVGSSSPFLSAIKNARSAFDAQYTANNRIQTVNVPVTVTGVGFFDFIHGQTGVAPNGIELHPVLDIQFGSSGTPTTEPITTPTFEHIMTPTLPF